MGTQHDRQHRLVGPCFGDGVADRGCDLVRTCHDRRHEEHDEGVDVRVGEERSDDGAVGRARRRPEHVDRVHQARLSGHDVSKYDARVGRQLGQRQAFALAGVGTEDPEPAGIGDDGDTSSPRQRLVREERCRVEELLERACAKHACLAKERVDGGVRPREGGGV